MYEIHLLNKIFVILYVNKFDIFEKTKSVSFTIVNLHISTILSSYILTYIFCLKANDTVTYREKTSFVILTDFTLKRVYGPLDFKMTLGFKMICTNFYEKKKAMNKLNNRNTLHFFSFNKNIFVFIF